MKRTILTIFVVLILSNSLVTAKVLSQWRGPKRDGVYPETGLLKQWPAEGPKMLWSTSILGQGFSSPSVTDTQLFITGMVNDQATLFAFDLSGKLQWQQIYGKGWSDSYPGERCTPTVADDNVYVFSSFGDVVCYNCQTGKQIWKVNVFTTFSGENITWGVTESLLIDDDKLFVTVGGKDALMVALNKNTGALIWKTPGNGQKTAYSSPNIITHGGKRIILQMAEKSFFGVDAATGKLLWSTPHKTDWDINPNTPVYLDGLVYINSGYGTGSEMFELSADGTSIKKLWENEIPDSQIGATVTVNGYIYGSGQKNRGWYCVDWKTGQVTWSDKNQIKKKGPIISADGLLYIYTEGGEVVLAKPNPQKLEVISSFNITMGENQHWAHPVIKNGRLYIRHGEALMAFDIKQ